MFLYISNRIGTFLIRLKNRVITILCKTDDVLIYYNIFYSLIEIAGVAVVNLISRPNQLNTKNVY